MALAYLLSPTFEIVNTAGKPATGGYIEVYVSGSGDKYYCASDWNGTLHPFKIPLDSLGSNIVLAADGGAYDVFIYNRYGGLIMSRTNVKPGAGGGMGGGVITSSDGSITVTPTAEGVDLKVNGMEPSVLRAGAGSLTADGQYTFYELVRDGEEITVDANGKIRLEDGWYHFDATVRVAWEGASLVNSTTPVQLYTTLSSDVLEFDLSYEHSETVQLGGEVKITTGGTQFVLGITGLEQGMVAELVDFGIHTITGHGDAAGYEAGDGIVIEDHEISIDPNYVQETLSAGTGIVLEDNEISVDTDVIQEKLTAGSNIVIEGTTISATAEPQLQANWTEADSLSVQYIQNKPTIKPVVAGSNITITEGANSVTISSQSDPQVQADYAQSNSSAVDYIKNKPTIKPVVAGSNITITEDSSNVTIAATVPTYTAGDGLSLSGTEFSASVDGSTITTNSSGQLQSTPEVFEAIVGVTTWQAVMEAYLAGKFIYGWTQNPIVAGARRIEFIEFYTYDSAFVFHRLVADTVGDGNCTVFEYRLKQNNTWEARQKAVQKPADWNAGAGTPTSIANKPVIPIVDQTYDATSANAQSGTAVAEAVAGVDTGLFEATYGTTTLSDIQSAISAHKIVYCRATGRMAFLAYIGPNQVEFQYYRSNAGGTGDSVFVYTVNSQGWTTTERPAYVQSDWSTSSSSAASFIKHKPDLSVYATTSAMDTALATKQDTLTAGTNITISAQNEISANISVPVIGTITL